MLKIGNQLLCKVHNVSCGFSANKYYLIKNKYLRLDDIDIITIENDRNEIWFFTNSEIEDYYYGNFFFTKSELREIKLKELLSI